MKSRNPSSSTRPAASSAGKKPPTKASTKAATSRPSSTPLTGAKPNTKQSSSKPRSKSPPPPSTKTTKPKVISTQEERPQGPPPGSLGSMIKWFGGATWRVVYLGPVFFADGHFAGLEQVAEAPNGGGWLGNTDGTVDGTEYFHTARVGDPENGAQRGLLVPKQELNAELLAQAQCLDKPPPPPLPSGTSTGLEQRTVVAGVGSLLAARGKTHQVGKAAVVADSPHQAFEESPIKMDERGSTQSPPLGGFDDNTMRSSLDNISGWGARVSGSMDRHSATMDVPRDGICTGFAADDTVTTKTPREQSPMASSAALRVDMGCQTDSVGMNDMFVKPRTAEIATNTAILAELDETATFAGDDYADQAHVTASFAEASAPTAAPDAVSQCKATLGRAQAVFDSLERSLRECERRLNPLQNEASRFMETATQLLAEWQPPVADELLSTAVAPEESSMINNIVSFIDSRSAALLDDMGDAPSKSLGLQQQKCEGVALRHQQNIGDFQTLLRRQMSPETDTKPESNSLEGCLAKNLTQGMIGSSNLLKGTLQTLLDYVEQAPDLDVTTSSSRSSDERVAELQELQLLVEHKSEEVRRLLFDAKDVASQIEIEGAEGNVDECEKLSYQRVSILQKAQELLTTDVLPKFAPVMKSLLEEPRSQFGVVLADATKRIEMAEHTIGRQWVSHCFTEADAASKSALLRDDTFVRDAYEIGTKFAKAKADFDECVSNQKQCIATIAEAVSSYRQNTSAMSDTIASIEEEVSSKVRLMAQQRVLIRNHIVKDEGIKILSHVTNSTETLVRTLRNVWIPAVEETEMASLMELQRNLCESRNAVHELHTEVHRSLCLSAGEIEWKKEQAVLAICDRIHTKAVEQEIASETLDPAAKEIAKMRQVLEDAKALLNTDIMKLKEFATASHGQFQDHTGLLLLEAGRPVPDVMAEVQEANAQRTMRIEGIKKERQKAITAE